MYTVWALCPRPEISCSISAFGAVALQLQQRYNTVATLLGRRRHRSDFLLRPRCEQELSRHGFVQRDHVSRDAPELLARGQHAFFEPSSQCILTCTASRL